MIAIAAAAAILGDNLGYLIGGRGVRWLLLRGGRGQAGPARSSPANPAADSAV